MAGSAPIPIDILKSAMRAQWMAGDFGVIAQTIAHGAEDFVARLPIEAGAAVLDVACGTGNVTIPLAKRGAVVTGVDIAPNLLEQARVRAAAAGVAALFDEGDVEQMRYPDASFDVVTTMFGAMFAPRPELAAAEIARVLRPGGLLAMANWTPGSFTGRMFRLGAQHVPPPAGVAPPVLWGDAGVARERLGHCFEPILTEAVAIDFDMPGDARAAVAMFRRYFGPTHSAFARLDAEGQERLQEALVDLWAGANEAADPSVRTLVPNEYLLVLATRR